MVTTATKPIKLAPNKSGNNNILVSSKIGLYLQSITSAFLRHRSNHRYKVAIFLLFA